MTSRAKSQSWIAGTLAAVLASLLLDTTAHEPRLTAQMGRESHTGAMVASKSIRAGLKTTSAQAGAIVARVGRMMRGK